MGLKRIKMIQEEKVNETVYLKETDKHQLAEEHFVYIVLNGIVTPVKFRCGIAKVKWETAKILRESGMIR